MKIGNGAKRGPGLQRDRSFNARQAFVMGSQYRSLPVPDQFWRWSTSETRKLSFDRGLPFFSLVDLLRITPISFLHSHPRCRCHRPRRNQLHTMTALFEVADSKTPTVNQNPIGANNRYDKQHAMTTSNRSDAQKRADANRAFQV